MQHLSLLQYRCDRWCPAVEICQGFLPIASAAPTLLAPDRLLDDTDKIYHITPAHIGGNGVFFGPGPDAARGRRGQSIELCFWHQSTPSIISGEARCIWSMHLVTNLGVNTIRSDHQIRLNALAIGQNDFGAVLTGCIAADRASGLHGAALQGLQPRE